MYCKYIVGIASYWHENGKFAQIIPYDEKGLPHGVVKWWDANGELLATYYYSHGTGTNYLFDTAYRLRKPTLFTNGVPVKVLPAAQ